MRTTGLALALSASLVAPAYAADKALSTMNQPGFLLGISPPPLAGPLAGSWIGGTSKGKTKVLGNCKILVKLSGTTLPSSDGVTGTGDEVICLVDFNSDFFGSPGSFVLRGEVNNGNVRIVADLPTEGLPFICTAGTSLSELRSTCYEPDPPYAPPFAVIFASDASQGVFLGGYAPRPATGLMATDSVRF